MIRYGGEKRVAFQTPMTRIRAVKTAYSLQLHRILDSNTVPQFEAFLETVMRRVQSTAKLDPTTRVDHTMQYMDITDETDIYGPDGTLYEDDLVAGNEYLISSIVALTGVWVSRSDRGDVVSWGPVWSSDQVKIHDQVYTREQGRVFFDGKPFFRLDL